MDYLASLHEDFQDRRGWKKKFNSFWQKGSLWGQNGILLEPQTYMNLSGQAVRECMEFFKIEPKDLVVAHDDLDLEMGRIKWDFKAGAAGHQGVSSIIDHLGTKEFYRVRMGIGRPVMKQEVKDFVLSGFRGEERKKVNEDMLPEAAMLLRKWIEAN